MHTKKTDELWHHGILKQKWGVKNGPPYPLDNSNRSPEQRKANLKSYQQLEKDFPGVNNEDPTEEDLENFAKLQNLIISKSYDPSYGKGISDEAKEKIKERGEYWKIGDQRSKAEAYVEERLTKNKDLSRIEQEFIDYGKEYCDDYMNKNKTLLSSVFEFERKALYGKARRSLYSDSEYNKKYDAYSDKYKEVRDSAEKSSAYQKLKADDTERRNYAKEKINKANDELLGIILKDMRLLA